MGISTASITCLAPVDGVVPANDLAPCFEVETTGISVPAVTSRVGTDVRFPVDAVTRFRGVDVDGELLRFLLFAK